MDQSTRDQVAGPSTAAATNDTQKNLPPCLKLLVDCWEHILGYLSFEDIHSLGGTCKALNCLAGYYFNTHVPDFRYNLNQKCVSTSMFIVRPDFYQFIGRLTISNGDLVLDADTFPSLKKIAWKSRVFNESHFEWLQGVLKNIESIDMGLVSSIAQNSFEQLAIRCPNLKDLNVYRSTNLLSQHFPHLERIQFRGDNVKAANLNVFLEKHLKLKSFSTDPDFLWANRDLLVETKVQLDILKLVDFDVSSIQFGELVNFLNALHDRGFYKELHVSIIMGVDINVSNVLHELPALTKLMGWSAQNVDFSRLTNLRELSFFVVREMDSEKLAKSLVHLERIVFGKSTIDEILPFIRYSKRLKNLVADVMLLDLHLQSLDNERGKLAGACPVSICLNEDKYLAAKWSTKNLNLNHIKVTRHNICMDEWL